MALAKPAWGLPTPPLASPWWKAGAHQFALLAEQVANAATCEARFNSGFSSGVTSGVIWRSK